jgi:hypothetical protein
VKNLPDGRTGDILAGGRLVLFGDGHSDDAVGYVERQDDFEHGSFQVGKAGAFGAGSLEVTRISGKKVLVEKAAEVFSKKKVKFS